VRSFITRTIGNSKWRQGSLANPKSRSWTTPSSRKRKSSSGRSSRSRSRQRKRDSDNGSNTWVLSPIFSLPILRDSTVDCRTGPSQQRSRDGAQYHQVPRGGAGQPAGRLGSQHWQTMSFGPHHLFPSTIFLDRRYLLPFDNAMDSTPAKERSRQFVSYSIWSYTLSLSPSHTAHPLLCCHVTFWLLYRAGCFCFDWISSFLYLTSSLAPFPLYLGAAHVTLV
jgi:hypothetical protein